MVTITYKYLKYFGPIISAIILFQSCKVYDKKPVSLGYATMIDHSIFKSVKVEMLNGEEFVFDSIYFKGTELYGLMEIKEKVYDESKEKFVKRKSKTEVKIDKDKIQKIRLQNSNKSGWVTAFVVIGIAIPTILLGLFIAASITCTVGPCF